MKKSIFWGCFFTAIILGASLGIIVHVYEDEQMEQAMVNQVEIMNYRKNKEEVIETSIRDEKTSPNARIIFETYYTKCGHSKISQENIRSEDVNKTEEEIKHKYFEWKIKSFKKEEIRLYREENSICDDHYVVKEKDGYVCVFSIDDAGNLTLFDETDISTKYFPQEDLKLLQNGIKANSNSELEQILSDYE